MSWRARPPQWAIALTIVLCLLVAGAGRAADEILTNELVIRLVAAGLSDGVIIEKIQSSPTRFDLGTDALIALKQAGVPDSVIQAMVKVRGRGQAATPDPLSSTPVSSPAPDSTPSGLPGMGSAPMGPFVGPGAIYPALGLSALSVLSSAPVSVKDTVIYIRDDRQIELDYVRGRVKQSGFIVYTSKMVLHDARAQLRITEERPTFYAGANPTELVLVRFKSDPKDNDRTLTVGKAQYWGYWTEVKQYIDTDDTIPIDFEKLPSGYYRVTPKQLLPKGEYGFLREGGGAGRAYDFGRE